MCLSEEVIFDNSIVGANLNLYSWMCEKYHSFLSSVNELVLGFRAASMIEQLLLVVMGIPSNSWGLCSVI